MSGGEDTVPIRPPQRGLWFDVPRRPGWGDGRIHQCVSERPRAVTHYELVFNDTLPADARLLLNVVLVHKGRRILQMCAPWLGSGEVALHLPMILEGRVEVTLRALTQRDPRGEWTQPPDWRLRFRVALVHANCAECGKQGDLYFRVVDGEPDVVCEEHRLGGTS